MPEDQGFYAKFHVARVDGRDAPGGDRENAVYFTLDLVHDPFAAPALRAYVEASEATLPHLAADLREHFPEIFDA